MSLPDRPLHITVFAGSSRHAAAAHLAAARALGAEIARRGHVTVYGGGRTGLMGALADAALADGGVVHGVILREFIEQDVHHASVVMETVEDMRSRKAGLDARAHAFVALPGGFGTLEELTEILSFRKLGHHHRPLVLLNVNGFYDPLLSQVERAIADGFERPERRAFLAVTEDPAEAVSLCEKARR
jgi:uncharacterized protein (TIGR00730 family)